MQVQLFWLFSCLLSQVINGVRWFPKHSSLIFGKAILCQLEENYRDRGQEKPGAWEETMSVQGQVGWVHRASWGDERQTRLHCLEGTSAFRAALSPLGKFAVRAWRPWFIWREFLSRLPGLGRERHFGEEIHRLWLTCVFSISVFSFSLFITLILLGI